MLLVFHVHLFMGTPLSEQRFELGTCSLPSAGGALSWPCESWQRDLTSLLLMKTLFTYFSTRNSSEAVGWVPVGLSWAPALSASTRAVSKNKQHAAPSHPTSRNMLPGQNYLLAWKGRGWSWVNCPVEPAGVSLEQFRSSGAHPEISISLSRYFLRVKFCQHPCGLSISITVDNQYCLPSIHSFAFVIMVT